MINKIKLYKYTFRSTSTHDHDAVVRVNTAQSILSGYFLLCRTVAAILYKEDTRTRTHMFR